MNLVVVESPGKSKTINKYLGNTYKVISSFGHIRDLPSKNGSVEPDKNFMMHYTVSKSSAKHVKEIVNWAKKSDKIYLATDPDREGEAISWHILEVLRSKKALKPGAEIKRISFNEITKSSVKNAIANPRDIEVDLVNAQQARRALDYLVGFTLSPVLWRKLPGSRSAGRVQSVALRLICDREDEIDKFITQEYWSIHCLLNNKKTDFSARLHSYDGNKLDKFDLQNDTIVSPVVQKLEQSEYFIKSVEKKKQQRHPYAPFITSTLQQDASRKLGFSAKKTMQIAQQLYEGIDIGGETVGLITYMRTDGVQLSQESVNETREYINKNFGKEYLPNASRVYKTKVKNAQEAHEAIRPTSVIRTPKKLSHLLTKDHLSLYTLVWKRTVACQMSSAIFDKVNATILTKDNFAELKATGSTIAFDGFYRVYKESKEKEDEDEDQENMLPDLKEGEDVDLKKVIPEQHFTEAPPRYNEASLVKKLEQLGIGRPSTYASIISVLQDRNYVSLEKKRFIPEDRGRLVTAFLRSFFSKYVEYDFTEELENQLDAVSDGKLEWKTLLKDFWKDFHATTESTQKYSIEEVMDTMVPMMEHYAFPKTENSSNPRQCPECKEGELDIRVGKFGPFVACDKYPDCKYTRHFYTIANENTDIKSHAGTEDKLLGKDNNTGKEVFLKKGPYGFYFQLGGNDDPDKKRSPLPKKTDPANVKLELAIQMLSLPREIGSHPDTGKIIKSSIGKFGPYVVYNGKFTSLKSESDVFSIQLDEAIEIVNKNPNTSKELGEYKSKSVSLCKGKYGLYIKFGKKNIKIPKDIDAETLDFESAKNIISSQE